MTRRPRIPGTTSKRTLFVLPSIPDDAPEELKDAIAIRNACTTEGRCPVCGAIGEVAPDPKYAGIYHITFRHEDFCPVLRDEDVA